MITAVIKMLKLEDICYVISRGKTLLDGYKSKNGDIYNLRLTHIKEDGTVILDNEYKYELENKGNIMYFYGAKEKDLIFPELVRNDLRVRSITNIGEEKIVYSARVIFARVNTELYNPVFLAKILNTDKYIKKLLEKAYCMSKGYSSTYQIRLDSLRQFEIPNIPIQEQLKILEEDKKLNEQISNIQDKLLKLYDI